ncbi:helix-turn-helix domain-containing protein [Streptomyces monticola]|uniref:Helix-turn-helix domain-containing protein n=1 Tax=Streptomyces monticola TaxID=2666263 RepID=A0ABW2JND1_9ACTN
MNHRERVEEGRRGGRPEPALPVECARLAAALRELRTATGLSLAALAAKTPYSKSSWERYLNGKVLPPRQAVEQLCKLAGERPGRPLALWELAEPTWSGRAGGSGHAGAGVAPAPAGPAGTQRGGQGDGQRDGPKDGPGDGATDGQRDGTNARVPAHRRLRSAGFFAGALGGLAAVAAGVLLIVWGIDGSGNGAEGTRPPRGTAPGPGCSGETCTGKDPEATRCSGAAFPPSTLAERRFGSGTVVKVRRSARCGTVWARIDRGLTGDRVEITAPGIAAQQTEVRDRFDEEGSLSTPMAAAAAADHPDVRACLVRSQERTCFPAAS